MEIIRRRRVRVILAGVVVIVLAAFLATGDGGRHPLALRAASDPRSGSATTEDGAAPTSDEPAPTSTLATASGRSASAPRTTTTVAPWDGTLHCDVQKEGWKPGYEYSDADTAYIADAHRVGRWVITIYMVHTKFAPDDHELLEVQDCANGSRRMVHAPPGGTACWEMGDAGISLDGRSLLYSCTPDRTSATQYVVEDPVTGRVQVVPQQPGRAWEWGAISGDGTTVVYTGHDIVWHQDTPSDVFVFDRSTGRVDQVPRQHDGLADADNMSFGVSTNGRFIGLTAWASNGNPQATGTSYRYDRASGSFDRLPSLRPYGAIEAMTPDGNHFAFWAQPDQTADTGVYVFDMGALDPVRISSCTPPNAGNPDCRVSISDDGNLVTFSTWPDVPVTGTDDRSGGTYTFDRRTGTVARNSSEARQP